MKRVLLMTILCIGIGGVTGCGSQKEQRDGEGKSDVVEVIYFHGSQRCSTCTSVEEITQNVLDEHFTGPLHEGKLCFREVDIIEQEDIAEEYDVVWSSLLLVDYNSAGEREIVDLTDIAFLNANTSPERLEAELFAQITKMLNN